MFQINYLFNNLIYQTAILQHCDVIGATSIQALSSGSLYFGLSKINIGADKNTPNIPINPAKKQGINKNNITAYLRNALFFSIKLFI